MAEATFGQRLKLLRKERDLHQSQLAEIFKISPSAVGSYERDLREPAYDLLKLFAIYFNCSLDYLLGFSDERQSVEDIRKGCPVELNKLIMDHTVTISGNVMSDTEKHKLIDVATGLFWDKF